VPAVVVPTLREKHAKDGPPANQKVKLDKSEATRGGPSLEAVCEADERFATGGIATHFSKSARSGAPPFSSLPTLINERYTCPPEMLATRLFFVSIIYYFFEK
jgi:hypothetical protein